MQRYYRTVMDVSLLNELLLQLFREAILTRERAAAAAERALPGAQRLARSGRATRCSRARPSALLELFVLLQQNPDIRGVRASTMRARGPQPVADRRGVPPEPAPSPPVPRDPARAGRRDARAAAHEHLRRARALHPGFRPHRRAHAVRPVPRLHRRCAHAVRGQQPAPLRHSALRPRAARGLARSCSSCRSRRSRTSPPCSTTSPRAAAAITPSSAPWTPKRSASSRACRPTTRAWWPGWCAIICELSITAQKQDIGDPAGHQCVRAPGRRRDPPRLPVRADLRRRARHQSEAVEFVEGVAVPRLLRARQARPAPRPREPDRPGAAGARDAGRRAAPGGRARRRRAGHRRGVDAVHAGVLPAALARGSRLAHAAAGRARRRFRRAAGRARSAQRTRHDRGAHLRARRAATASRAPPRCSTSSGSTSSTRASRRPAMASASTSTTCSRTTARRSPTATA